MRYPIRTPLGAHMPMATKEAQREYQRVWMAKRRAAYLADKACVRCGDVERLEIDHVDRALKVRRTDHQVWSWSAARREAELAKCQVLCHDCHLAKTVSEISTAECGTTTMYRKGCRCPECRDAHAAAARTYRNAA